MNVLLVPAHPGFPGQIPQSRKTVVVVVVVVVVVIINWWYQYTECTTTKQDK